MTIFSEIKDSFRHGNSLTRLIYINVGVFLLLHILLVFIYLLTSGKDLMPVLEWLAVPADPASLLQKPWTLFTYMFLHKDLFHILFNILWLYWFGKVFLSYFDSRKLLNVYILGGLSGGLLYFALYNLVPVLKEQASGSMAMGASAAVMAVVIAIASYVPEHRIYVVFAGEVKIIWIALISFILSSVVDFSVNTGGKIAHIGGALFGYLFILQYKKGKDMSHFLNNLINHAGQIFKRKPKMRVTHKRTSDDHEYNAIKKEKQKQLDFILDKISRSGYDSLTKEEKETLFKMSR